MAVASKLSISAPADSSDLHIHITLESFFVTIELRVVDSLKKERDSPFVSLYLFIYFMHPPSFPPTRVIVLRFLFPYNNNNNNNLRN